MKLIFLLVISALLMGQTKDASRRDVNLLENSNPGGENSTVKWSCSGGALSSETTNPLVGSSSLSYLASGTGQTCDSELIVIPDGLEGQPCQWTLKVGGGAPEDYDIKLLNSSAAVLSTVTPVGGAETLSANFTCPSAESLRFRVESTDVAPGTIFFDQAFIGEQERVSRICSSVTGVTDCINYIDGQLQAPDGSASNPIYAFEGASSNTGMYRVGEDLIGWSVDGTARLLLDSSGMTSSGTYTTSSAGSAGTPAYTWTSNTDTGFFNAGLTDQINWSAGGTEGGILAAQGVGLLNGLVGTPSAYFSDDIDTGIYSPNDNEVAITVGGAERFKVTSGLVTGIKFQTTNNGGQTAPTYSWTDDPNTGMYRGAEGQINFTTNDVSRFAIKTGEISSSVEFMGPNGSAGSPTYSFNNFATTGWYSTAASNVLLSLGNSTRHSFNSTEYVIQASADPIIRIDSNSGTGSSSLEFGDNSDNDVGNIAYSHSLNEMSFVAGATQAFNITSTGVEIRMPQTGTRAVDICSSTDTGVSIIGECNSSIEFKKDVEDLPESYIVEDFRPVMFNWKDSGERDIGFIAEEVKEVAPELATRQGVKYRHMVAIAFAEIQRLKKRLEVLEGANNE